MTNIINWFKDSNRYKHFGLGVIFGTLANSWYCAEYGAIGVGGALELKDKLYGNKFDIVDFILTIIGFNLGYLVRFLILSFI